MHLAQLIAWIPAVLALLALLAVGLAGWQLRLARHRVRDAGRHAQRIDGLVEKAAEHAERAADHARHAQSQAGWAWEQVKHAADQLQEARAERRDSAQAELWEWAYALTRAAGELVEATRELIRVALDARIAPRYRLAAERHYRQSCGRWHEAMTKAMARTAPSLELQQKVLAFTRVHHRLHGQTGMLLRAAETGSLNDGDQNRRQVLHASQELETLRRQLQRTLSDSLAHSGQFAHDAPESGRAAAQHELNGPRPGPRTDQLTLAAAHAAATRQPTGDATRVGA